MSHSSERPPDPTQPSETKKPFSSHAEQEDVKNFTEPTPLDQLIPGIDLSKLTSKEKLKEYRQQIDETTLNLTGFGSPSGDSDIGRDQSDTNFYYWANFDAERLGINKGERYLGKVIIDIGSGNNESGYELAEYLGAKAYVAVDPFAARTTKYLIKDRTRAKTNLYDGTEYKKAKNNKIPWNCVESDGLDFLKALPPNSVCVVMSGISDGVIPDKHLGAILKEIERVLAPDGAFLSISSDTREAANFMDIDPQVERDESMKQLIKRSIKS